MNTPPIDPSHDKASLRASLRAQRRAMSPAEQAEAASRAAGYLDNLPDWQRYQHVALYVAADGELDPTPLAQACRQQGRTLYLPRLLGPGQMCFAQWEDNRPLERNRYGIPEPDAGAALREASELDLMLLPLVGWDRSGNRLGMGAGYYDRALAEGRPRLLVGLAYGTQEVDRLPADPWDIRLDFVLCESGLVRCDRTPG
ncbi:5-formyltetrahydrofolate cyclo-ligase [Parahaliea maris]|uniref:5-formyltetrahydrofolate cyclo-ligase n=1 Tax=Parahaliea maris TaxID=2716870 RepID=A0A5C9A2D2_9GAMM|nr:5-formyltetrahydrofolate cyclo-ligase [Parahaliea maris]TXS93930.1 5-formyltetrahydrofolate cyclo-ligase [Parahaliea maris]